MNTTEVFPHIDASQRDCITDEQANFFRQNGLLVIRNVLKPDELSALQEQTLPFVQRAMKEKVEDPDYFYRRHEITGQPTPFRIEYIIDKTDAAKSLLAHPFILRSVEKLQGPNFIPTWDSMVFKTAGAGAAVPWHRDAGPECTVPDKPIFNVDFYLDHADITNCLWGILGSNNWTEQQAQRRIQDLNTNGFQTDAQTVP